MNSALERIAFMTTSEHRLAILQALAEGPKETRELRAETGASHSTVGRTLNDLTDFGWVVRHNGEYGISPVGELVVEEFGTFLETMEAVTVLEAVVGRLPVEEMDVPLSALGDGELLRPTDTNPTAHLDRGLDRLREADQVTVLADAVVPRYLDAIRSWVAEDGTTTEHVYGAHVVDALRTDDRLAASFEGLLAAEQPVLRYDGTVPYTLFLADGVVLLLLAEESGPPEAFLASENEDVLAWARSTVESFREGAEPVDPV